MTKATHPDRFSHIQFAKFQHGVKCGLLDIVKTIEWLHSISHSVLTSNFAPK